MVIAISVMNFAEGVGGFLGALIVMVFGLGAGYLMIGGGSSGGNPRDSNSQW
tara:strand:+ start:2006 stop:2161 length:156 start_codon:yes stop_codon:yes gene_type:complete